MVNLQPGQMLLHFRVVEKIDAGGMGVVYRAHDTRLRRAVALKLPPPELVSSEERRLRFLREARAAAAINHRNVAGVYEIGEVEGLVFIVMELVQGKTLREIMGGRPMPVEEVLRLAIQTAEGLAAAHKVHVVHRDLKPANVMVTSDGHAKILDFGLAKVLEPVERDADPSTLTTIPDYATREGTILGTPAYMSPEQARGESVDLRSDIFSFGSVLYEMLTGRPPFVGRTKIDILSAIVRDKPRPPSRCVRNLPAEFDRIVAVCLEKKPRDRFQHAEQLAEDLKRLERASDGESQVPPPTPSWIFRRWLGVTAALTTVALSGFLIIHYLHRSIPSQPPRVLPLTSLPGTERWPALSPDGRQVAFGWMDRSGDDFDLYVKLVDGSEQLRLTDTQAEEYHPTWSPDGTRIAFLRDRNSWGAVPAWHPRRPKREGEVTSIVLISLIGGAERELATSTCYDCGISWSPDGRHLAIVDKLASGGPDSIYLLSIDSGQKRKLTEPPLDCQGNRCGDYGPAFSPDGQELAFVRTMNENDIYLVSPDGDLTRLSSSRPEVRGLSWTPDGRYVVFAGPGDDGRDGLWKIPATGGPSEPLPIPAEGAIDPSLPRLGNRLAFAKEILDTNIWRIEGPEPISSTGASEIIASTRDDWGPDVSPDGRRIAFASNRTGTTEIWMSDIDGRDPAQLTFFGGDFASSHPAWSPDGRMIAFARSAPGQTDQDLYLVPATGGVPKPLLATPDRETAPFWSNDGEWIYFQRRSAGNVNIFRIPRDGGRAVEVTRTDGITGEESPDGKFIYFTRLHMPGIWRVPTQGGSEVLAIETREETWFRWDLSSAGIFFADTEQGSRSSLNYFDFSTGQLTRIAVLDKRPSWQLSVSPDGRWIFYDLDDFLGADLMLVELP